MAIQRGNSFEVGERHTVSIEKVAHGGHFIARHEGQVIFVRHAIPGELVEVEITSTGSSFVRGDAIKIIEPSVDRVSPPCAFSHPGGCGGCDFQHIAITRQRELKADVIREQFSRIAKREIDVTVEEIGPPLHWRTRVSSATNEEGKIGFYASRTHTVIPVDNCVIAAQGIDYPDLALRKWPASSRIEISASSTGARSIAIADSKRDSKARMTEGEAISHEDIYGHQLQVSQASFWQSHESAPEILSEAIREFVREGDHVLDLYGGVGLFAAALIDVVGTTGCIDLIESSTSATADARRNFADFPNIQIHIGEVVRVLTKINRADVVVLDPPREGAGKDVIAKIVALGPRAIVYVACDPAALARDTVYLQENGFNLKELRAFDLFPMTHHVECVALMSRVTSQ
jgi:tRNA/tmRNA/rRNA uracil-C5-methylase (TrmA/RlmC/RlmD family)